MAGRGFLKSRLAQMNAKNSEQLPKPETSTTPEEKSKFEESSTLPNPCHAQKVSVPIVPPLITGPQQVVRGRRALLSRVQKPVIQPINSSENITSTFSNLKLKSLEDLQSPATMLVTSVCSSPEISKSPLTPKTQQQEQSVCIVSPKEEKSPVVCRVLKKSDKDPYQMSQFSTNHIKIKLEEDKGIYEYKVDYNPPVDDLSTRFYLVNQHQQVYPVKIFDGTLLNVPTKLQHNVSTLMSKLTNESDVTLIITYKRKRNLQECIGFYNVFLRSAMKTLGLVEFSGSYCDQNKKIPFPEYRLEVWPEYKTTIAELENGVYMCCEVSHRILRVQTVLQIMTDISEKSKNNNKDTKQEAMTVLCGSTVITLYNRKTYRIDDIDFSMSPLSKFNQNGNEISFVEYYRKMYDIEIKNVSQPLLITKPKKMNICIEVAPKDSDIGFLVPELCNLTELSDKMKSDFKLKNALQAHTSISPELRQQAIIDFVNQINDDEKACTLFKNWGIILRPIPVLLEGPVYKRETILFGNSIRKQVGSNMVWGMDVAKNAMFVAFNLTNWAILYCPRDEPIAKSFCKQFAMCGGTLGMDIKPPARIEVNGTSPEIFVSMIIRTFQNNSELQLVVIMFPNQREDRYNAVKRICCVELGIPSQIIVSRTLAKPERLKSITQNIALKINCKLGGACWAIDIPLQNTMIVGIDIYQEKNKLFNSVGFVASMDKNFTKWYAVSGMQKSTHQEIGSFIQEAFYKSTMQYRMKNGNLPEKIIIYRDGVSQTDFKYIEEIEIFDLQESFKTYPGNYNPMITYIIVQKCINTRIFGYMDNRYSNPSPGTVIDNTITKRNFFDFYLVPQQVHLGTVNPTHYIVLKNGCYLKPEHVQRLSYKLCHMYYNCTGTVKVPAPVLYAHNLAYLIGHNIRQMPSEKLNNTLFYL